MLEKEKMKINYKIDYKSYKEIADREILQKILLDIGSIKREIVILGVDSISSGDGNLFREKFPKRVFDFGIAEANMISAAAGFSMLGKIPIALLYGFLVPRISE